MTFEDSVKRLDSATLFAKLRERAEAQNDLMLKAACDFFSDETKSAPYWKGAHALACEELAKVREYAEQLKEALQRIASYQGSTDSTGAVALVMRDIARTALSKNTSSPNPAGDTPYRSDAESGKQTDEGVKGPAVLGVFTPHRLCLDPPGCTQRGECRSNNPAWCAEGQSGNSQVTPRICVVTGNPCGTDTVLRGMTCPSTSGRCVHVERNSEPK